MVTVTAEQMRPCASPARLADVAGSGGATLDDVLDVAAVNGERWSECRARVRAWQEQARRSGWVAR